VYQLRRVAPAEARAGLVALRRDAYDCFARRADGLFEVMDALAGADRPVRSLAELTAEVTGCRGWGTFYQALGDGEVDAALVKDLLAGWVRLVPPAPPGESGESGESASSGGAGLVWPAMFAVDTTVVPRPDTRVVDDVGMHYVSRGAGGRGVSVPAWAVSWLVQVGEVTAAGARTSWALPVDAQRVGTAQTCTQVALAQLSELVVRLARRGVPAEGRAVPLLLADAGYCPISMTQQLPGGTQILVALRSDRVFRGRVPASSGPARRRGRPPVHGPVFALHKSDTWGTPDAEHEHRTVGGAVVYTRAWHQLHPKPSNGVKQPWQGIVEGTVIRQETRYPARAGGRARATRVRWLWWAGPTEAFDLPVLARAYAHRYTIEHMFRFFKQDLFWTGYTPLTTDRAERWNWIVALAYTQLHLARSLAADHPAGWRQPLPADRLSPRRVRRDFRRICAPLPTPTNPPKTSRPGPGRPKGSNNTNPRPRQPVHVKGRPTPTSRRKPAHPRKHNPTTA
jgi:hypothetical protein